MFYVKEFASLTYGEVGNENESLRCGYERLRGQLEGERGCRHLHHVDREQLEHLERHAPPGVGHLGEPCVSEGGAVSDLLGYTSVLHQRLAMRGGPCGRYGGRNEESS